MRWTAKNRAGAASPLPTLAAGDEAVPSRSSSNPARIERPSRSLSSSPQAGGKGREAELAKREAELNAREAELRRWEQASITTMCT